MWFMHTSNFTISGHREKSELYAKVNITIFFTAGWLMHFKLSSGFYVLHTRGEIPPLENEAKKFKDKLYGRNQISFYWNEFTKLLRGACFGSNFQVSHLLHQQWISRHQETQQCVLLVQVGSTVCSWLFSQEEKPESLQDAEEQCQFITTVRRLAVWAGRLSLIVETYNDRQPTMVVWKQQ